MQVEEKDLVPYTNIPSTLTATRCKETLGCSLFAGNLFVSNSRNSDFEFVELKSTLCYPMREDVAA
jgi:hypothetical protein